MRNEHRKLYGDPCVRQAGHAQSMPLLNLTVEKKKEKKKKKES
jgi:hypothetical protein